MSFIGNTTAYPTVSPAGADLVPIVQGGILKTSTVASLAGASSDAVSVLTTSAGVVNIDCALGTYYTLTLTANVTSITFSNLPAAGHGTSKIIWITQGAGPYTVAWPASFKWKGGVAGTVSVVNGQRDTLGLTSLNSGTAWDAVIANNQS